MNNSDSPVAVSSVAVAFLIFLGIPFALVTGVIFGALTEGSRERDRTILYCIDSLEQCKIEYTYLKLKEKQK